MTRLDITNLRYFVLKIKLCLATGQGRETEKYPREHDEKILGATRRNQEHFKQCQVFISSAKLDQQMIRTFIWSPGRGHIRQMKYKTFTMKKF